MDIRVTESTEASPRLPLSPLASVGAKLDVRDLLRMINRRKWHIIGIVAIVVAATGLLLSQLTPEYRATALVMLDTRKAKVTNTADVLSGLTVDVAAVQTEIEVLKS